MMKAMMMLSLAALAGCGSGGAATSTDVKLQNATARSTSLSSGSYEVTFNVVNGATRAIDRLQDGRLSTGGAPLQNASAVGCAGSPWTLPPGGSSGVVTLSVTFSPQPTLQVECDATGLPVASTALVSPPSAPARSFEVRVEGLLTDAEPFIATATAPIL